MFAYICWLVVQVFIGEGGSQNGRMAESIQLDALSHRFAAQTRPPVGQLRPQSF